VEIGAAGRRKVEVEFDVQIVIQHYLKALDTIGTMERPQSTEAKPGGRDKPRKVA
jgi:hypothetical protein